jgi:1-acyl-sn-glycerol-3-phosphate acyltransferase
MLRLGFALGVFALGCLCLIAVQLFLRGLGLRPRPRVAMAFYKLLRRLLRLRVSVVGAPAMRRPLLIVSNHTSWIDIAAIGAIMPVHFVAKREVRGWPLVGRVAELTGTIFVDRDRRRQTAQASAQIADRLAGGCPVVLFAEGTSSDGNRVLPFRSALIGVGTSVALQPITLQPMSIAYTRLNGLPIGRRQRPLLAWYGDMDFLPHLRRYLRAGPADAVITFGEPLACAEPAAADRKVAARALEASVRQLTSATLRGHSAPEPA